MTSNLTINHHRVARAAPADDAPLEAAFGRENDLEIRIDTPDGPSLVALVNARGGWLMYLPGPSSPGYSSRNAARPDPGASESYRLANGQVDEFPAGWTYSRAEVLQALCGFLASGERPATIDWCDDSGE